MLGMQYNTLSNSINALPTCQFVSVVSILDDILSSVLWIFILDEQLLLFLISFELLNYQFLDCKNGTSVDSLFSLCYVTLVG